MEDRTRYVVLTVTERSAKNGTRRAGVTVGRAAAIVMFERRRLPGPLNEISIGYIRQFLEGGRDVMNLYVTTAPLGFMQPIARIEPVDET